MQTTCYKIWIKMLRITTAILKETGRYSMANEETGDEWHAQNKLRLTVFGIAVHWPCIHHVAKLWIS